MLGAPAIQECPVVPALRFCGSGPYKVSGAEAGNRPGRTRGCGEASSQEVHNNSKQSSNKGGPSNVLTYTYPFPCIQSVFRENIAPRWGRGGGH